MRSPGNSSQTGHLLYASSPGKLGKSRLRREEPFEAASSPPRSPAAAKPRRNPGASDDDPMRGFHDGSYLAPLVPMVLAKDAEIRRQAVCALANLTDEQHRAAVASLKDAQGRSLLRDLLLYTAPPFSASQRLEAVLGLSNLLRSRTSHSYLVAARLLPELLQLVRNCPPDATSVGLRSCMRAVACLCANEQVAAEMLRAGFAPQLLLMAGKSDLDGDGEEGRSDLVVRRHIAQALAALSLCPENQEAMQECGALPVAAELLRAQDRELRRH